MRSDKEMAPTKKGANDGEENSPCNSAARNLSPSGGGLPAEAGGLIGAKSWRRRWGRSADSMRSGKEMAPTKTGANNGEDNSLCSSLAKNLSMRGGGAR